MRFLFAFVGGPGHFEPLVPVASALEAAGHVVAFAAQPRMVPIVEARGFAALATGPNGPPRRRKPLLEVSMEREWRDLRERFAGRAGPRADALLRLDWRPDALVRDEADFGAAIAAERLGLPWATVLIAAAGGLIRAQDVAEPLDALRAERGLPPDPELAALTGDLVLSPFPPSLRPAEHALRFLPTGRGDPRGPVYFSLGTEFNLESGDLFARVLDAVRATPDDVRAAVEEVRSHAPAAEALRDELDALPGVERAVELLTAL